MLVDEISCLLPVGSDQAGIPDSESGMKLVCRLSPSKHYTGCRSRQQPATCNSLKVPQFCELVQDPTCNTQSVTCSRQDFVLNLVASKAD